MGQQNHGESMHRERRADLGFNLNSPAPEENEQMPQVSNQEDQSNPLCTWNNQSLNTGENLMNSPVRVFVGNEQETGTEEEAGIDGEEAENNDGGEIGQIDNAGAVEEEAEADDDDDDEERINRKRKIMEMLCTNPTKNMTSTISQRRPTTCSTFVSPSHTQTFSETIVEDDTTYGTFNSGTARKSYKFFVNKLALEDKGFDEYCLNALPYVKRVIRTLGLESLCAVPDPYNLSLIKEFYAEVCAYEGNAVQVRGKHFSFEPEVINDHLGLLPPSKTEFDRLMSKGKDEDWDMIAMELGQQGRTWMRLQKVHQKTFKSIDLRAPAYIWFYFIKHNIIPTTHNSTLNLNGMALLHCLLQKKTVNIGKLICDAIRICIRKHTGKMFFPSLLTDMVTKAGVKKRTGDVFVRGKLAIDRLTVGRLLKNCEQGLEKTRAETVITQEGTNETNVELVSPVKSLFTQVNTLTETIKKQNMKLKRLEHFHKRVWEYEEAKDFLIKQACKPNFANLVAAWSVFLQDVFDEYNDGTSEKEEGSSSEDNEASTDADHE